MYEMKFFSLRKYKSFLVVFLIITLEIFIFAEQSRKIPLEFESHFLLNFTKAIKVSYPENFVTYGFDGEEQLWFIDLSRGKEIKRFFYKYGRLLPKEKLSNWKNYNPLFTEFYPKEIPEPNEFSDIKIEYLKYLSLPKNRDSYKPSSFTLVQNFLYKANYPKEVEPQIVTIEFLDWKVRVHNKIVEPLLNIDKKIRKLALTDSEVDKFLKMPTVITGYNWREVRDNENRSSHSWGISIDIVPKKYGSKQIYWKWTQDFYDEGWITYPIKKRWIPPIKVLSIFESEGFIWGGKWDIWDNMHFEYHPEILHLSKILVE